jgi:hypothetical protein
MEAAIRHMVVFNLKCGKDAPEAKAFIAEARRVFGALPIPKNVIQCAQINPMCGFDFGFSFDFMKPEDYERYNNHPDHIKFVEEWWKTQVADFMEIDFEELD